MAAFTDLSDYVNRSTGGSSGNPEPLWFNKIPYISAVVDTWAAGLMYSMWRYDGVPGGASTPGAAAVPTKATAGALPFTNGSATKRLCQAIAISGDGSAVAAVKIYDRLLHIGGLSGTVTTAQEVQTASPTPALTRYTGGEGNEIWIEINTVVGTTPRTITANYTNQAGTTGRTTQAMIFGGSVGTIGNDANLFFQLPLQAGDTGVRAVDDVTIAGGSTGAAGDFGVVIAHPFCLLPANNRAFMGRDWTVGPAGMPEIVDDACIAFALMANSTGETVVFGGLNTVESA